MSFSDMINCKYLPLTEVLSFIVDNRGKTVPTAEIGIPLIATNCIKNNELYPVFEKVRYLSEDTYQNWFRAHPIPGDIIFVNKGAPGRVCLVPNPVGFCIAQDMMALRVNDKIINNRYLFAVLRSPQFQTQIEQFHVGTLIPHFKKGDLDKLLIPIPSMDIQKFIGETYYSLCNKIEINSRINKTLEEMAQAIFKSWFVDFEFPDENDQPYKSSGGVMDESEVGLIPKGWSVYNLGDLVNSVSITHKFKSEKVIFLNTSDILDGRVLHHNYSQVKGLPGQAKKTIQKFDILFTEIRPANKRFALIDFEAENYVVSTKLMVLRKIAHVHPAVIYGYLTSPQTLEVLQHLAESRSGTFPQITFNEVKTLKITLPQGKLLEKYTALIWSSFETKSNINKQTKTLEKVRDTLLPKLMSGEIRIPLQEAQ